MRRRSIKRGRSYSLISGIVGIFFIGVGIYVVYNNYQIYQDFAPSFIFSILWLVLVTGATIINFYNFFSKNRISTYDIVDAEREKDPLDRAKYCPKCGSQVSEDAKYCQKCGNKLF